MRFCHPFTLTAGARDSKQAPPSHRRICLKPTVQCDQPRSIVFSPRAIFPGQVAVDLVSEEFERISVCT